MNGIRDNETPGADGNYHSAEFKLTEPGMLYQFKIRKSVSEPMFAAIKEGSTALKNIKEGDIINMRYYPFDPSLPPESRNTKIKYVVKDTCTGFKGHYIIGLDIYAENDLIVA
jgi:hypothetical protein